MADNMVEPSLDLDNISLDDKFKPIFDLESKKRGRALTEDEKSLIISKSMQNGLKNIQPLTEQPENFNPERAKVMTVAPVIGALTDLNKMTPPPPMEEDNRQLTDETFKPQYQDYINRLGLKDSDLTPQQKLDIQKKYLMGEDIKSKGLDKAMGAGIAGIGAAGLLGEKGLSAVAPLAYPALVGLQSAKDIYNESNNPSSPLAKALSDELANYNKNPSAASAMNFPATAERAGEIVGGNVVPQAGVNLLEMIAKALTGTVKGVSSGAQKILGVADNALADTQTAIAPLANSRVAQIIGALAGASDKGIAAKTAAALIGGKPLSDIVTVPGYGPTGSEGGDQYLSALEAQARSIINKPIKLRTKDEQAFLESYPENRSAYLKSLQDARDVNQVVDTGNLNPKTPEFTKFNGLLDTKAQIQDIRSRIQKAIADNDVNAIQLIGNQIAAVASVANQQGVVNGEEVNRVLNSVQTASKMIQDGKWVGQNAIILGRELWGGLNTFGDIVDGGLNAKLLRYKKTYDIPDKFFKNSGLSLESPMNATPEDIITPERADKAAARATAFDTVKRATTTGGAIPAAVLGFVDATAKALNIPSNFSKDYNPQRDNKKIEAIINQYYANENRLYQEHYQNSIKNASTLDKVKQLTAAGDLAGIQKLLNETNTSPTGFTTTSTAPTSPSTPTPPNPPTTPTAPTKPKAPSTKPKREKLF